MFGQLPESKPAFNMTYDPTQWNQYPQYNQYLSLLVNTWRQEYVFFGLDDNGYFVAYTPSAYNYMHFYTSPVGLLYGHLIVEYQGTVTPFFRRFVEGNKMIPANGYDLMDNMEQMRVQYALHNLQWNQETYDYWYKLFQDLYPKLLEYTPGNNIQKGDEDNDGQGTGNDSSEDDRVESESD